MEGYDLSKTLIKIAQDEHPEINFQVGDAQKTPYKEEQFDIVCSDLMIHYINKLDKLFSEIARILRKNGTVIFSFHHPVNEVAIVKKTKNGITYTIKPYFHNDKYKWNMLEGMELVSYHHTFDNISISLQKAGFVIERIVEPRPTKSSYKHKPSAYNRTSQHPSFCIIKARKK